jgi:hypothetical protein
MEWHFPIQPHAPKMATLTSFMVLFPSVFIELENFSHCRSIEFSVP